MHFTLLCDGEWQHIDYGKRSKRGHMALRNKEIINEIDRGIESGNTGPGVVFETHMILKSINHALV